MPELPEVETVRRTLKAHILNETIKDVSLFYPKMVHMEERQFKDYIIGQTIRDIKRMGKYLIFILDDHALIIHLRMEGKFFIKDHEPKDKHEHVIFTFDSNRTLRYHDVRKFGTLDLVDLDRYMEVPPLNKLGLEPKDLSVDAFYDKIRHKNLEIKPCLLDQTIISGLGNIYVDETLFHARIHPLRKGKDITYQEANHILNAARKVLDEAVLLGGTTIRSYTSSLGVHGRFQLKLQVHMKKDEPCPICKTPIIKMKVKGRGTYVCPNCQD